MLQKRYAIIAVIPLALAGYMACAGEGARDDPAEVVEAESDATTARSSIIGTFRSEQATADIAVLTLKTDSTYHMEEGVVCVRQPCNGPQVDGRYKLAQRGDAGILTLTGDRGSAIKELQFQIRGDTLYLLPNMRESRWQALTRSERSWCEQPSDCRLQNLPAKACPGRWDCEANVCAYPCRPIGCDGDRCPPVP